MVGAGGFAFAARDLSAVSRRRCSELKRMTFVGVSLAAVELLDSNLQAADLPDQGLVGLAEIAAQLRGIGADEARESAPEDRPQIGLAGHLNARDIAGTAAISGGSGDCHYAAPGSCLVLHTARSGVCRATSCARRISATSQRD